MITRVTEVTLKYSQHVKQLKLESKSYRDGEIKGDGMGNTLFDYDYDLLRVVKREVR